MTTIASFFGDRPLPTGTYHNVLHPDARGSVLRSWRAFGKSHPSEVAVHVAKPWRPDVRFMLKLGQLLGIELSQVARDLGLRVVQAKAA